MEKKMSEGRINVIQIEGKQLGYILPSPRLMSNISVEESLRNRRSRRSFREEAITANDLSQILWAAYGVTLSLPAWYQARGGYKTAPSAGATYPLEVYALVGNVKDIEKGVYKYVPDGHKLIRVIDRDIKADLSAAALDQDMIRIAPVCLFFSAVYNRTTRRYGRRGYERYVCMDLGHSAQNVYLQTEALHLGTCAIGAFNDEKVRKVMQLSGEEEPLYIMPVGKYLDKPEY
jgi:SagB-type dehydrogenase family enzyme